MEKGIIFLAGLIIGLILMAACVAANNIDKKLDEEEKKLKTEPKTSFSSDEIDIIHLKEQIARVDRGESSIISCPKGYSVQKIDDKWVIYRQ